MIARSHHILQKKQENLDLMQSQQDFLTINQFSMGQFGAEPEINALRTLKKKSSPKKARIMNSKVRQSSGKPYLKAGKKKVLASSVA